MEMQRFTLSQGFELARRASIGAGASEAMAASLAEATVSAEACGQTTVGFRHLVDYLTSLVEGRIDGDRHGSSQPAADAARHDDRADHTPSGGEDQERTYNRRQITAECHCLSFPSERLGVQDKAASPGKAVTGLSTASSRPVRALLPCERGW